MILKNFTHIKELDFLRTSDCYTFFDGTNDFIDISNNPDITSIEWNQPFSFFYWIKKPESEFAQVTVNNYRGSPTGKGFFSMLLGSNPAVPTFTRAVRFQFRTAESGAGTRIDAYSQAKYTPDVWQFIGISNNGSGLLSGLEFYVNEVQSPQPHNWTGGNNVTTGSIQSGEPFVIGALLQNINYYSEGCLKHLAFADDVLTPAEFLSAFNKGHISPNYSDIIKIKNHYPLTRFDYQDRIGGTFATPSGMLPDSIICE